MGTSFWDRGFPFEYMMAVKEKNISIRVARKLQVLKNKDKISGQLAQ